MEEEPRYRYLTRIKAKCCGKMEDVFLEGNTQYYPREIPKQALYADIFLTDDCGYENQFYIVAQIQYNKCSSIDRLKSVDPDVWGRIIGGVEKVSVISAENFELNAKISQDQDS